ncbi:MAG: hypothetical protein AAGI70_05690 [Pseudomonadota bacterium]
MAKETVHPLDPRGLIGDAYRIEGIGKEDCRSIFFDWALGLPPGTEPKDAAEVLIAHHGGAEAHPMTVLLREAAQPAPPMRRRGGWRSRHAD